MLSRFIRNNIVPLLLRLGLAAIFIYHGQDKVAKEMGSAWAPPEMEMARAMQTVVAWAELVGGIALAAGFLTRVAAAGIMVLMIGAIATVTGSHGFSALNHGYEYNFLIIVVCLALVLFGPGNIAVDRFFRVKRRKQGAT